MSWEFGYRPYVPVAVRRAKAAIAAAKAMKAGKTLSPVRPSGRTITRTFWGKAWCDNLESYSDYENRLPRGRTYLRNGSVIDLRIDKGSVKALVSGSSLYKVSIAIEPLSTARWQALQRECAGQIHSLIELLEGRVSSGVMQLVSRRDTGLFPSPAEIRLGCSCPDWADMCKHVAAALYGVGTRLDERPELLFLLRGVDPAELISKAAVDEATRTAAGTEGAPTLSDAELSDVFGIDISDTIGAAEPSAPEGGHAAAISEPPRPAADVPTASTKSGRSADAKKRSGGRQARKKRLVAPGKSSGSKAKTGRQKKAAAVRRTSKASEKRSTYDRIFGID